MPEYATNKKATIGLAAPNTTKVLLEGCLLRAPHTANEQGRRRCVERDSNRYNTMLLVPEPLARVTQP